MDASRGGPLFCAHIHRFVRDRKTLRRLSIPGYPKNCSRDALFRRLQAVRNGSGVTATWMRAAAPTISCSQVTKAFGLI